MAAALMGCNDTGPTMAGDAVVARATIPPEALVGLEEMAQGRDRSGNFRWYIDDEGCLFHARNSAFFVAPEQAASTDPSAHWNRDLPSGPQRCLTAEQQQRLRAALAELDVDTLARGAPYGTIDAVSDAAVLRWTFDGPSAAVSVTALRGSEPSELQALHRLIDELVAAAPLA